MTYHHLISASSLDGKDVKNAQGEKLGHVRDIMIDSSNHNITYYVLSFGGILGMGDKLFAIPPEAMAFNQKDKEFTLNIAKDRLKTTDGFDKDHWPDFANPNFRTNLYKHYGYEDRFAA
ncbi:MAG: PRC-barrel domain-containing protein [Alphaproteobacteria bacterium]|nr:PRC-barrel domain-containing protein [Alphaproteobacteria bacterium]